MENKELLKHIMEAVIATDFDIEELRDILGSGAAIHKGAKGFTFNEYVKIYGETTIQKACVILDAIGEFKKAVIRKNDKDY
jgi:hypothetical protein